MELAGVAAPEGDAEVIALGAAALAAAGLTGPGFDLTIDLGHLGLTREVLRGLALPDDAAEAVRAAIAKRDRVGLDEVLRASRVGGRETPVSRFARALPDLSGDATVLEVAARQAPSASIRQAIADLQAIVQSVEARAIPARLHIDLAEVRGFDYYTGVRFQGFVAGAAAPVLQGGRYDDLLGRYGRHHPAVGFAVDVEAAAGALEIANQDGADAHGPAGKAPVLVVGAAKDAVPVAEALRAEGRRAAALLVPMSERDLTAYAARWGYREIVRAGRVARAQSEGPNSGTKVSSKTSSKTSGFQGSGPGLQTPGLPKKGRRKD